MNHPIIRVAGASAFVLAGLNVFTAAPAHASPPCDTPGNVITGTRGDDVLIGGPGRDVIRGRGGDDVIKGKGGPDSLYGGRGNDEVAGGKGDDCVFGGPGVDTVYDKNGEPTGDNLIDGGSGEDDEGLYHETQWWSAVERGKYWI